VAARIDERGSLIGEALRPTPAGRALNELMGLS